MHATTMPEQQPHPQLPAHLGGFTLVEVLASITVFSLVLTIVMSLYTVTQRQYQMSSAQNELWQNVRVVLDRVTREVRQAETLATALPATPEEAVSTLMFQDGHDTEDIRYIRYRIDGASVWRDAVVYSFAAAPSEYVPWDARDEFDTAPTETVLDEQLVGEHFTALRIWGENNLIHIEATLEKNGQTAQVVTAVYGRNL